MSASAKLPSGYDPDLRRPSFASGQFVELFNGLGVDGSHTPQPQTQPLSSVDSDDSPNDGSPHGHDPNGAGSEHDASQLYYTDGSTPEGMDHQHHHQHSSHSHLPVHVKTEMGNTTHDYATAGYGHNVNVDGSVPESYHNGTTASYADTTPPYQTNDQAQQQQHHDPQQQQQPQASYYYGGSSVPIDDTGAIQVGGMCVSAQYMDGAYYDYSYEYPA